MLSYLLQKIDFNDIIKNNNLLRNCFVKDVVKQN